MKPNGWVGSIGLLLLVASCGQDQTNDQSATSPPVQIAASPSVATPAAVSPASSPAATVRVPPAPPVLAVPDLIPPTSAAARVPQINAGRTNPYANVTSAPRVSVPPTAARPAAAAPTVAVGSPAPTRSQPAATTSRRVAEPQSSSARPPQAANPPAPQPAAVAPSPTAVIARSIAVSGVVQTSGQTSAIVQVPQEGSRYVNVGDRLAGGRVLVKRIEAGAEEAIVVFEQDGIEVSRPVGTSEVL